MSKTLKTIQTLHKIGRVLSKIVFICCIVGAAGCALGLVLMPILDGTIVNVMRFLEKDAIVSVGARYASMSVSLILCVSEAVIAWYAERYFVNELAAGTPFTMAGSKELLRLGILTIAVSLGGATIAAAVYGIFSIALKNVVDMDIGNTGSIGTGIAFILGSLLCRLGAEQTWKPE